MLLSCSLLVPKRLRDELPGLIVGVYLLLNKVIIPAEQLRNVVKHDFIYLLVHFLKYKRIHN